MRRREVSRRRVCSGTKFRAIAFIVAGEISGDGIKAMDVNGSRTEGYRIPSPELREELKLQREILMLTLQRVTCEVSAIAKKLSENEVGRPPASRRAVTK